MVHIKEQSVSINTISEQAEISDRAEVNLNENCDLVTDLFNSENEHEMTLNEESSISVSDQIESSHNSSLVQSDSVDLSENNEKILEQNQSKSKKWNQRKNNFESLASRTVEIKIAGVPYKIRSNHDEQVLNQLISLVNDKISDAIKVTKNASFQNAAVLASLNLAEEILLLKKQANDVLLNLELQTQKLKSDLNKLNLINSNKLNSEISNNHSNKTDNPDTNNLQENLDTLI